MNRVQRWTARVAPALLLSALVTTAVVPSAQADPPASGPGSYDTTFGAGTGRVNYGNGFSESFDSVAVQPDGKIVAGFTGAGTGLYIYRLDASGSLDSTWGGGSPYFWDATATGGTPRGALAQDSAGRTYVTSALPNGGNPLVAVLRLTTAGLPDATWGTNGVVTYDFPGNNANDHGTSVVVDDNRNRVYVGAWEGPDTGDGTDFAVLAFQESNGSSDSTFSGDGLATTDFNHGNDTVRDIAIAPGGDVVAVGYVKAPGGSGDDTGAWRLNADGSPSTGFGGAGTGKAELDLGNHLNDGARSVAIDDLGYLFLSVRVENPDGSSGAVLRLDTVGAVDPDFGRTNTPAGTGVVFTQFGASGDNAGIAVDASGRAVVVGGANAPTIGRLVATRYAPDPTFNSSGSETLTCPGGTVGAAQGVAIQPDGAIVVTGTCPEAVAPHNANVNVVWRLKGGDQVPLPTTPLAYPTGPQYANLHATGISVNGGGRTVTVAPGSTLSLNFTYSFDNRVTDDICGSVCITQVVAGFVDRGPDLCFEAGGAELSGATAAVSGTLAAPVRPGRYYIGFGRDYENACASGSGTWTGNGKPWSGNLSPTPDAFLAEVDVVDGVSGLTVTTDRATVPFGQGAVPVENISLDDLAGSLSDLQASPLRVSPLRVSPLRVSPLRVSPLRVSPLRVSPLRVSPLRVSPLRVSPIPLSEVPLDPPNTWAAVLAGTPFANQPLQNVTLQQLLDLDPAPATVSALSLADIDLSRTALRNVSMVAFLLGSTPVTSLLLSDLPSGVDASKSLLDLELTGTDLSAVYAHSIRLASGASFALDAPLGRMRLGDLWLSQTPFGALPLSALPATWYDASGCSSCTTLADVQANNVDTGVKDVATVGAALALNLAGFNPTIGSILPGLVSRDQLGYERLPSDQLAAAAPLPNAGVTYTARFTIDCSTSSGPATVDFDLPAGFRPIPSTAAVTVDGLGPVAVTTSHEESGFRLTTADLDCAGAPQVTARVDAEPSLKLGPTTDSATARFGTASTTANDDTPVTVVDSTGDPPYRRQLGRSRRARCSRATSRRRGTRTPSCCRHCLPAPA